MDNKILPLQQQDAEEIGELIRLNLKPFEGTSKVLAASYRRSRDPLKAYSQPGTGYFTAKSDGVLVGGAGFGPLHGLPLSEQVGEIRDLFVNEDRRGQGFGRNLLKACLDEAVAAGYRTIYLETTPGMTKAQHLFLSSGFRPVDDKSKDSDDPPHYFVVQI